MKKMLKNPRVMVFIITGLALLVAIITSSIAWFSASGSATVGTRALQLVAQENSSLSLVVPDLAAEYERYMGETGTEYDGEDYPYLVEYSPVIIDYSEKDTTENKYLTYYFDSETSYIQRVIHGSDPIEFTSDDLWDNFVMNLRELTPRMDGEELAIDEDGNPIYDPTGVVYYGENGYFRNVDDGTILSPIIGKNYFALDIYFQGDVGYHLLATTQSDIDAQYAFDYSNEIFMFAKFHLCAVFNLVSLHDLQLDGAHAYDATYTEIDEHRVYFDEQKTRSSVTIDFTGFSLQQVDGSHEVYKVPELYYSGEIDYSYYFKDWFASYTDELSQTYYYVYRSTKANGTSDDIVTLSLRPLRGDTESLSPGWDSSYVLTLANLDDIDDEEYQAEYYVRPQGNYYSSAGYLTYEPSSKTVSVNNPRGGLVSVDNQAGTAVSVSNAIPAPSREGFRFLGWSTVEPEGDYAADADVSGVPFVFTSGNSYQYNFGEAGNGHDLTLYAVWQELGANVTVVIDSVWGHNYATVVADHIRYKGVDYDLVEDTANHCYTVTIEVPKHTSLSAITVPGAVATITATGTEKNLTLRTWNYYEGGIYYDNNEYPLDLEDDVTIYAMWNQRAEYTITIDATMDASSNAYMEMTTKNMTATNIEHYSLIFNGYSESTPNMSIRAGTLVSATIKTVLGVNEIDNEYPFVITVLEGMTWNDINATVTFTVKKVGTTQYSLDGWYENVSNNNCLYTSFDLYNKDATEVVANKEITSNKNYAAKFKR